MSNIDIGSAKISLTEAVAGSRVTLAYTYTAGHPIDDTGCVKVAFRFAGDFGVPQFHDPTGPDYCSVTTTGDCRIDVRWDLKGNKRPWGRAIYLKVMSGFLDRGEQIRLVFGDTSAGSPGWRVETFREDTFEFKTFVDPIATFMFKELPQSPELRIVPGPPAKALCLAPSTVLVDQPFTARLKLEDRWGNPCAPPRSVEQPGFSEPGIETVTLTDPDTGLSAESNPIDVRTSQPALRPFWADFHGQSEETIGSNTIEQYFTFARDLAFLDIAGHQGNDFQITDAFWRTVNETTKAFYVPGRFVTFPGYEWSGNTPLGGDRNIYFESEGGAISHSCRDLLPGEESNSTDSPTADELFAHLKSQTGPKAFAFAHVGGRYADMRMHDSDVEVAVEIHSAWGTFEWLLHDALKLGYRVGVCANSDGHKGRPGRSYPGALKFGSLGGLTCMLAEELDRASIVAALRERHCYATTGNRLLLDVRLSGQDGADAMMGDIVSAAGDIAELRLNVAGTGSLERVDVFNGCDLVETVSPVPVPRESPRIKIVWSGAEVRGRARRSEWDGSLAVAGNSILDVVPINFWNPDRQIQRMSPTRVEWESITTGGTVGMVLVLEDANAGEVDLRTTQRDLTIDVSTITGTPKTWECGGLEKRIRISRLPEDAPRTLKRTVSVPLRKGTNPLYVRVTQEDGHMAWSSPIYVDGD